MGQKHSLQWSHPVNAPVHYPEALEEQDLGLPLPNTPVSFTAWPGPSKRQWHPQIPGAGGRVHPASPSLALQAAEPPFPPGEGSRLEILPGSGTDPIPLSP